MAKRVERITERRNLKKKDLYPQCVFESFTVYKSTRFDV